MERGVTSRPHGNSVLLLARALGLDEPRLEELARVGGQRDEDPVLPLGRRVPQQLPHALAGFVGREAEMGALGCLLDQLGDSPGAVVIAAIGGTAGAGKTALAVQWAHRVAARFPDGQLYVNLRGFDPSGSPADPAEVIRGFLDALGVPASAVPAQPDAQTDLYRSVLAGKRMLVVLDNARDEQQVRPLLPASPASLVIVTSRNQLAGLAAADGALLLPLDLLAHDEAVRLLIARLGASRAGAEPGAVDEIASLCARLPLALVVAAARAAARPRVGLAELAAELRDVAGRLDALDAGDPAVSVAAVFSWSCGQLSPAAARMFRLLGLHPGPDVSVGAAASLAAAGEPQARRLLRELARGCLVTEHAPGRYSFHDLLRGYAADQARERDSQPDRDAAIGRLLDYYLHTAARAAVLLRPGRKPIALAPPRPGAAPGQPGDRGQALAWFKAEHQVLLVAVTLAAETGADRRAWQLLGQAVSLRGLGQACFDAGNHDHARAHLERCLPWYQRLGDHGGEAWAQHTLAVLAQAQDRHGDALDHGEQALRLYHSIGHQAGEAEILGDVAWCHAVLGDYQRARACCEQSLALIGKLGGCQFECAVWDTLGYIEHQRGDFARAAAHFELALGLCRDHGDRYAEAGILTHAGDARHAAGELPQARQAWQQALAIYGDFDHPNAAKVRAKLASAGG
jgi:tetratricopeptide (TPR) repeat protein